MATTQKRGDSYRITVSCGYDIHGKQIRHTMTWTPDPKMTPRQVEKELKRQTVLFEERIKNGTVEVNGKIKLKDFCEKFLDEYAHPNLKHTTVRNYERDIERICEALGHLKLESIKPAQITRFYNSLMKTGSNKATGGALDAVSVAAVNRTFSAVMGKAVKWGYINSNPVSRAEKPRVEQKESTYLDADEARHMLELIQDEPIHWRTVIIFDLFSGLRRQELLGLKWEDIDFDKRTITVRRTVNYVPKKGVYESTTKSKKSRRPLHISVTAVSLLLEVQRWQEQRSKELGDAWKGEGYVFTKCSYRPALSLNSHHTLSLSCHGVCPSTGHQMPGVTPRHLEITPLLPASASRSQQCTEPYGRPPAASAVGRRTSGSCRTAG
jgi:integrase